MDLLSSLVCDHRVGEPVTAYIATTCPRCRGKSIYHDISFDNQGKLSTVQNGNQLNQQLTKLLTEIIRNTGYGFDYSILTGVIDSGKLLVIKRELTRCFNVFLQNQTSEINEGYNYKLSEELDSIDIINVFQNTAEPRTITALVNAVSVSGNSQQLQIPLRR